ncbi:MAG: TM0106 family RecB-like putative nuclease [Planctomycetes bacterium]|nr:TM0106 family RecB-like putative nuclease [Planctomycetota bacterium]
MLTATDLANHLGCRHLTALDLRARSGHLAAPTFRDPVLEVLAERGKRHEAAVKSQLRAEGKTILEIEAHQPHSQAQTEAAIRSGVDVIYQAHLAAADFTGYADFLLRVDDPSGSNAPFYEVLDAKLARTTRAGTILQLSLYSEILAGRQGRAPERMHVIKPGAEGFERETHRVADFAAYYQFVKSRLAAAVANDDATLPPATYPEPCAHCDICRWRAHCNRQRREDDHLSWVAGMQVPHAREFEAQGRATLEALAKADQALDRPPDRGHAQTYVALHAQARAQFEARETGVEVVRFREPEPARGLALLPEPSEGDVFFDIEGDAFAGAHGLEYLLGWCVLEPAVDGGERTLRYEHAWADDAAGEKRAYERFVDAMTERRERFPGLHIYHFAPYEPAALRRLLGKYGTREAELDWLLRGERFVDLHAALRQGLVCSVERYGLKEIERFTGFERRVDLEAAGAARRQMEFAFELERVEDITDEERELVRGYNHDDCASTHALREWLEQKRRECIAAGHAIERRGTKDGSEPGDAAERQGEVAEVYDALVADVPLELEGRSEVEQARWLLAHALDYWRREAKVGWWEFHARRCYGFEEALEDRKAVAGLSFVEVVVIEPTKKRERRKIRQRYAYPPQDVSLSPDDTLYAMGDMPPDDDADAESSGGAKALHFGAVDAHDEAACTIDVVVAKSWVDAAPSMVFEHDTIPRRVLEQSLLDLGRSFGRDGSASPYRASVDLLTRALPRLRRGGGAALRGAGRALRQGGEDAIPAAIRIASDLDGSVLGIQGPPGAGKSHTGAEMIVALARAGKRIGVTAVSHKVIHNLLAKVQERADASGVTIDTLAKVKEPAEDPGRVRETKDNAEALEALESGSVVGGVAWLWARDEAAHTLDYLVVDEAGQMSLAMVLAASRAAKNLVLLGDPAQLEQPQQAAHPEGVAISALEHLLGEAKTMPEDRGLFLAETWRLHPEICAFTSEQFYEGRLRSRPGLDGQCIEGATRFEGAGLFVELVEHEGNTSASREEVLRIQELVRELLAQDEAGPRVHWRDASGDRRSLTPADVLIVAPYNAQLAKLQSALLPEHPGLRIGTVDKFQGQEAPVVIYSMAASSPEDAPRGMAFLYSANRLNVATSRARCAVVLVASGRLFEPECRTVEQLRLANGLCRFRQMARVGVG